LPLHLTAASVTLDPTGSMTELDLEFCALDSGISALGWAAHASEALADIDGALRVRRIKPFDPTPTTMLTLNPVTDLVPGPIHLSLEAPPRNSSAASSIVITRLSLDLEFTPTAWRIPVPPHTHAWLRLTSPDRTRSQRPALS